ncbi:hypothetical protein GHK86_04565 [Acidimicrobiaceae bacterium USS-CC1]|uniref:Uncharacterized protein n=1 Tax=Acidiferrimicrobium australe TaxID=2664430 RepID=A0ABW9QQM4_9ACTN|nr:hypothetical protein [Acidiferrimicrobium australe]
MIRSASDGAGGAGGPGTRLLRPADARIVAVGAPGTGSSAPGPGTRRQLGKVSGGSDARESGSGAGGGYADLASPATAPFGGIVGRAAQRRTPCLAMWLTHNLERPG